MKIILGIDPGSRAVGYGVIQQGKNKLTHLDSGCIRTKTTEFSYRLRFIYAKVAEIITQFRPHCLAIERIFVAKNVDSAMKLGHARGAMIVAASNLNIPVFEYTARQVKQTVVGTGSAEKKQVQYMVYTLLRLSDYPQVDAADALAVAITHCNIAQNAFHVLNKRCVRLIKARLI